MAEIFLIAPQNAEPQAFAAVLSAALERIDAKALLLPRGQRSEGDYKALVKALAPLAQVKDIAVLIEGEPGEVRKLGADGLHVTSGIEAVEEALSALKPDFIVGVGNLATRDDAMTSGELGIDYVMFGPLSGPIDAHARDLAHWWAETMEVPSVLSDPGADAAADAEGCDFLAIGDAVWGQRP